MEPLTPAANTPTAAPAPELVCPAGSLPALKTAVDHGADCVYLGFKDDTNARNFSGLNFDDKAIAEGVRYAHQRRRKVLDPEHGYEFFDRTYFPHYGTAEPSVMHRYLYERLPRIAAAVAPAADPGPALAWDARTQRFAPSSFDRAG